MNTYKQMGLYSLLTQFAIPLKKVDLDKVFEIRLRASFPIKIKCVDGEYFLTNNGISNIKSDAILCTKSDIDKIILTATERSIYAFNDRIKEGYITYSGIRIGVAGECVFDNGKIITIKNFTSLNVRIPHDVIDCSKSIRKYLVSDKKVFNTLIISPPSFGKTTMLKDVARYLCDINCGSIMIIDERGEFQGVSGENIDIISYSDKLFALSFGLRSMSPDVIIADELITNNDWEFVKKASYSGVKVLASCHGQALDDVYKRDGFIKGVFDRFIVLNSKGKPGQIKSVYDKDFNEL